MVAIFLFLASSILLSCTGYRGFTSEKASSASRDILTHHGDNTRVGWYNDETILTPANVNSRSFGKLWERDLGGQVYGQPLFVHSVTIGGRPRNVIYAATMTNRVHAIDADNGEWLWPEDADPNDIDPRNHGIYLGPPDPLFDCPDVNGPVGVLSTMVIDRASNTLFLVNLVNSRRLTETPPDTDGHAFFLHALDLATGREKASWPVRIEGAYGSKRFNPRWANQRGALMFLNGRVYITFGSRCDKGAWHGWIFSYNASNPAEPPQIFCAACSYLGAGIWGAAGPSADADGNLYVSTGNAYGIPVGELDLSNTILRLATRPALRFHPSPRNFYTPSNQSIMNRLDWDLGSSSVIVLPQQPGTSTPNLLATGGKDGRVYLIYRDHLGGYGGSTPHTDESEDDNPKDTAVKRLRLWGGSSGGGIQTIPAYFAPIRGPHYVYVTGSNYRDQLEFNGGKLVALQLTTDGITGRSSLTPAWESHILWIPQTPVVSSSGGEHGIVWVIDAHKALDSFDSLSTHDTGILNAYHALTGTLLYTSKNGILTDAGVERDRLGETWKNSSPIIRDGKVYVGTTGIVAFGLLHIRTTRIEQASRTSDRDSENLALRVDARAISNVLSASGLGNRNPNVIRDGIWKFSTGRGGATQFDTHNGTLQMDVFFGIRFPDRHQFNEMDFQLGGNNDGNLFNNGGWFVTGSARLQVFDGKTWKTIPDVQWSGYRKGGPDQPEAPRTARFGAPLRGFDIFTTRFPTVSGYGIRIIGTPGQGDQSDISFGSCGQIRVFKRESSPRKNRLQ